jgi:hypothetical protein
VEASLGVAQAGEVVGESGQRGDQVQRGGGVPVTGDHAHQSDQAGHRPKLNDD